MSYRMKGTYFESCNCDVACPCGASNLLLPATNDRCDVLLAFHVEQGDVDGVDVGGTTVALLADTPAQHVRITPPDEFTSLRIRWRGGPVCEQGRIEVRPLRHR